MFLGVDLGSSSIKLSLFDTETESIVASLSYPKEELSISVPEQGWAEQDPNDWWDNFTVAFEKLITTYSIDSHRIKSIGISYQMHGLVLIDEHHEVLRPSIIWCDSRAVEMGNRLHEQLGDTYCQNNLLNKPGNFTASKLAWVKENEPDTFSRVYKFMLPGDFLAMKLSNTVTTTDTGLSEGIFWDFEAEDLSNSILGELGISDSMIPERVPAIGAHVRVSPEMAMHLGLNEDVTISYRCGDQPNNAFSLNVLQDGEIAATAGTSGVIYAVTSQNISDEKSRINTFKHVNGTKENPRNGVLICVNGTGILYSWLKRLLSIGTSSIDYELMNNLAKDIAPGSEGIQCLPFGNGAERIFENQLIGAHFLNLNFNVHSTAHILRAAIEGIIYALNTGFEIFKDLGGKASTIRVGHANLFLSKEFREIFVQVTGTRLELYDTDGAAGAARGAALGYGFYSSTEEAFQSLNIIDVIEPKPELVEKYHRLYHQWLDALKTFTLNN